MTRSHEAGAPRDHDNGLVAHGRHARHWLLPRRVCARRRLRGGGQGSAPCHLPRVAESVAGGMSSRRREPWAQRGGGETTRAQVAPSCTAHARETLSGEERGGFRATEEEGVLVHRWAGSRRRVFRSGVGDLLWADGACTA